MIELLNPGPVLFIGPVEIVLVGIILLVLLFGPRAPEIAQHAGEAVGKFQRSKKQVEDEVEEVRDELEIDEDINEIKGEVEEIKGDVESTVELEGTEKQPETETETSHGQSPDNP